MSTSGPDAPLRGPIGPNTPLRAPLGPALDSARGLVVERNLVRAAFDHLTVDAFMTLGFEALGPTKALLKRFFSTEPWTSADDEALADAVGRGEGRWQRDLDADLVLTYGWTDGSFGVRVSGRSLDGPGRASGDLDGPGRASGDIGPSGGSGNPLASTFDGPVVPEATPNPRTIRFQVGPIHDGPSRWFESAAAVGDDDPGVARLFSAFDEVANVLVGSDFVAVGLRRASDWEGLLRPVLEVVTEEFASTVGIGQETAPARVMGGPAGAGAGPMNADGPSTGAADGRHLTRLERAWRDLGSLHPADATDLEQVRAAAQSDDSSHRQVAASLLREADASVAASLWTRLATDPARSVRRAAVDAMVDVDREDLRPVLEAALSDSDNWIRWKAMRGLTQLGAGPSREAIAAHSHDPDFHVRLEAAAALRSAGQSADDEEPSSP